MHLFWSGPLVAAVFPKVQADQGFSTTTAESAIEKLWQSTRQLTESPFRFEQFNETLSTMQTNFWSGASWTASAQWINAFVNTLISSSAITMTMIPDPEEYGTTAASLSIAEDTLRSNVRIFFENEDTVQIFGAAYDDAQWVVLEWLDAIRLIQVLNERRNTTYGQADIARYAHRAHIFYNRVQDKFNTSLCDGGLTWDPAQSVYKNAITNELFLSSSSAMFLYWPGDTNDNPYPGHTYFLSTGKTLDPLPMLPPNADLLSDNAEKAYKWLNSHNFTNSAGLFVDGFHVSANQTKCDLRSETVYTYNQGVLLSGLRDLYAITSDINYLISGHNLVSTVMNATGWRGADHPVESAWSGLGRNGIMEDACDAIGNCTTDAQMFKGIYFHHLSAFCRPELTSTWHHDQCAMYAPWIAHNAAAALSTKNATGIIGGWWGAKYSDNTTDPNAGERGRNIQTHASGLAVVKAALDIDLWQRLG